MTNRGKISYDYKVAVKGITDNTTLCSKYLSDINDCLGFIDSTNDADLIDKVDKLNLRDIKSNTDLHSALIALFSLRCDLIGLVNRYKFRQQEILSGRYYKYQSQSELGGEVFDHYVYISSIQYNKKYESHIGEGIIKGSIITFSGDYGSMRIGDNIAVGRNGDHEFEEISRDQFLSKQSDLIKLSELTNK